MDKAHRVKLLLGAEGVALYDTGSADSKRGENRDRLRYHIFFGENCKPQILHCKEYQELAYFHITMFFSNTHPHFPIGFSSEFGIFEILLFIVAKSEVSNASSILKYFTLCKKIFKKNNHIAHFIFAFLAATESPSSFIHSPYVAFYKVKTEHSN